MQGLGPGCRGGQLWDLCPYISPIPCRLLLSDRQAGQSDAVTTACFSCCAAQAYQVFGLEGCKAFNALTFTQPSTVVFLAVIRLGEWQRPAAKGLMAR